MLYLGTTGTSRHQDGDGPLGSLTAPGSAITYALDAEANHPVTVGIGLCTTGRGSAVLTAVTPTKTAGTGWRFLGLRTRTFVPTTQHPPGGSWGEFPPNLPDSLSPVAGTRVSSRCPSTGILSIYTELLIGMAAGADTSGGGWLGVDVSYTLGRRAYVVSLGYNVVICGTAVASLHVCR